jgi:predicted dehydrogenase
MKGRSLRAGLIGCGAIGSRYDEGRTEDNSIFTQAGMFSATTEIDFACITEPDPVRRKACQAAWKVPVAYADHLEMLDDAPLDIVGLATPDETHATILEDILAHSKPKVIFTEKPLCESAAKSNALGLRCETAGIALIVDYVRRHDENHTALRHFLSTGGIGQLHTVSAYYVRGIRHNGCQMINLLRFFLGDPVRVRAFGLAQGALKGDPSLDLRLEFAEGLVAQVMAMDRKGYSFSAFETEFSGDRGRVRLDATGRNIRLELIEPYPEFPDFNRLTTTNTPWPKETYGQAMLRAGQEIVRVANGEAGEIVNNWREASRDIEIIEAAITSAMMDGIPVNIPPANGHNFTE